MSLCMVELHRLREATEDELADLDGDADIFRCNPRSTSVASLIPL
jgi:hypothetical protein